MGRYVLVQRIGSGGMGIVHRAYDPELDRSVAIKVLWPQRTSPGAFERLRREAMALARVVHPNVVQVLDVGECDGRIFVAMELVRGPTLSRWLEMPARSPAQIFRVFLQAARGLAAAHQAGLVHRDFKPDNVLVGEDGRTRVVDFGIVRLADSGSWSGRSSPGVQMEGDLKITRIGGIVGTPAFMAPEQRHGEDVDARADQFSFCVSLYRALYGTSPYDVEAISPRPLTASDLPRRPRVPSAIAAALLRGLAVDPAKRYDSMTPLVEALTQSTTRRRRWLPAALTVGVLAVGWWAWPSEGAACHADEGIEGLWTDDTRARIDRAVRRSSLSWSDEAARLVTARLDEYALQWDGAHRRACEQEDTGLDRDARLVCLDRARARFERVVSMLTVEDYVPALTATEEAASLPPVTRCEDAAWLDAAVAPPDPRLAPAIEAARRTLGHVRGELAAGRFASARSDLDELRRDADAVGYAPLQAEVAAVRGQVETAAGHIGDAIVAYERAYASADTSGNAELAVAAAAELARLHAQKRYDVDRAGQWIRFAYAAVSRAGLHDTELEADIVRAESMVAVRDRRLEAATELASRSLDLFRAHLPEGDPRIAEAQAWYGVLLGRKGHFEEATTNIQAAIDTYEASMGSAHPQVAEMLLMLARPARVTSRFDDAHRYIARAFDIRREAFGERSPHTIATAMSLAEAEADRDDGEAALAIFSRFPVELVEGLSLEPWQLANYHRARGKILLYAANDAEGAIEAFNQALVFDESEFDPTHSLRARDLTNLAVLHRRAGEFDKAEERGREAARLAGRAGLDPASVAAIRINLANVYTDLERHDQASAELRKSIEILEPRVQADTMELVIAQCLLAASEARRGHRDEAERQLERARSGIAKRGGSAKRETRVCNDAAKVVRGEEPIEADAQR